MVTASDGDCYPSSPMRLVHRHTFINALPKSSPPDCFLNGRLQVPSYFLLQFVVAVTASDGDCYLSNFRPRQCGLFIVILSSTLSLKTVHRTVFLTVAFKSRYQFACKTKKQINKKLICFMVRVTGLEPVRRETHAPQTCLSAYSSTLAFISHFSREQY